jgi:hypothetical protein
MDVVFTAGLNGLNWQVQVCPPTLAMVTVPPCFGVELVDDRSEEELALFLFFADPVQALTPRVTAVTAATAATRRVRFMLVLLR